MNSSSTSPRFVVGVDFGTTFTSVAFAHSSSPEEVKLVRTWPNCGTGDTDSEQVPTELHYTSPGDHENIWGYGIPKDAKNSVEPLKWFKLLLQNRGISESTIRPAPFDQPARAHRSASVSSTDSLSSVLDDLNFSPGSASGFTQPVTTPAHTTEIKLKQLGIEPVEVVTDFLSHVREVTVESIEQTYQVEWVRNAQIEYVLTVPAIWTDSAKDLMVKAAKDAGFGKHRLGFNLVSEPEAAAAYTLRAIQPNDLNAGFSLAKLGPLTIADIWLGGGTVDLISYKIEGLNPLKISEAATGSGELCGSVFVDQRFEQYIRGRLGNVSIDNMRPRTKNQMMESWERKVKFRFGNTTGPEGFEVNVLGLPDSRELNIEENFHSMETKDVQAIFDPVVDYIVKLVNQQYWAVEKQGKSVAAILLVGGFGSSVYLLKQLGAATYGEWNESLPVLQPMNADPDAFTGQSLISLQARGALIRGLDGSIVRERLFRRHYGSSAHVEYVEGSDHYNHRTWSWAYDEWRTDGHMTWYFARASSTRMGTYGNSPIVNDTSASFPFFRTVPIFPGRRPQLIFEDELFTCEEDQAPGFKWRKPGAVNRVCTLRSDLSRIRKKRFCKITNSGGQEFYEISFSLRMSIVDEVLKFELLFEGQSYGTVTAEYD